jgi:hypothetical protein
MGGTNRFLVEGEKPLSLLSSVKRLRLSSRVPFLEQNHQQGDERRKWKTVTHLESIALKRGHQAGRKPGGQALARRRVLK